MKNLCLYIFAFFTSFAAFAALPPITGTTVVCEAANTTLSNTVSAGTWTSSAPGIASIHPSTGVVLGVVAGTVVITYTDGTDFAYATVTVNALPAAITGVPTICDGSTTTLASTTTGGTWSSTTPAVAPVATSSGIVTAVASGTTTISYTLLSTGCARLVVVTVNPLPSIITGLSTVCTGTSIFFTGWPSGGSWTSFDPTVATVTGVGFVAGVTPGTATIAYTLPSGCAALHTVTVNPGITAITGVASVCVGGTTSLSNATTGGIWSSSNVAVASVDAAGVVSGYTSGTTHISYTVPSGCNRVVVVTVNAAPGTITGSGTVCAGSYVTLSVSPAIGGTWSSAAPLIATVGTSGVVYGAAIGTATIAYSLGACGTSSRVVTVNSTCSGTPVTGGITASASIICSGTPLTLNLPSYSPSCGHVIQWQYSPDGLSWSNLPGANTVPYIYSPTAPYYYRCGITCASSSASAYSGPVYVGINFSIGTSTVIATPDPVCAATHFYIAACGVSPSFSLATYYGDGTADTTALSSTTLSDVHKYHTYSLPGTYTVKHVLFNGAMAVDTVTSSYNYLFCRTLPIKFYIDNNSNCVFDAGESYNLATVMTRVDSAGIPVDTISATSEFFYKALGGAGTVYAFRPFSVSGGLAVSCPSGLVIYDTITSFSNTYVAKSFALTCASTSSFDLRVQASSLSNATQQRITIMVSNFYCTAISPVVTLSFSPKYGYYPSAYPSTATYPAPSSTSGTSMTWNLSTMAPDVVRVITVYLMRPTSLGTPLPFNDTINYSISVSPTTGDLDATNNVYTKLDSVRAAYDPNDIAVTPEGYILPCTQLQYKVRFENMGNDTAHNIYVLDTLSDNLDPSTLQVVTASDAMSVSVINDGVRNIAKFDFPNIKLLDSSHHGLNDGIFIFNIKARTALSDGATIANRVGIYFDYNPVVMTNEVTNTIGIAPIVGSGNVCIGYPATFTDNTPGGTWVSSVPATGTITGGGVVSGLTAGTSLISYTVSNTCASRTATKEVTVNPVVIPTAEIGAGPDDTVCAGTPVIYTATTTFGGTAPVFTWRVDGVSVGSGTSYTYTPLAGDVVTLSVASSQACAMPAIVTDTVTMEVVAMATPVASIGVSPNDTSCAGTPVTFTATPSYGGATPGYIWFINGTASGVGASYTFTPASGDVVYARMGSNFMCRLVDTVNSSSVNMTVDPLYIPVISVSASPSLHVSVGEPLTLTASVTDAGPAPVYQWLVNGYLIPGANAPTYTSTTYADYDSVTCKVTGSGVCNITSFNSVRITIWPVGVSTIVGSNDINVFPNPNNGAFSIKGSIGAASGKEVSIVVSNMLGQVVYTSAATTGNNGLVNHTIQLPGEMANGVYMLNLHGDNENRIFRFVVSR